MIQVFKFIGYFKSRTTKENPLTIPTRKENDDSHGDEMGEWASEQLLQFSISQRIQVIYRLLVYL